MIPFLAVGATLVACFVTGYGTWYYMTSRAQDYEIRVTFRQSEAGTWFMDDEDHLDVSDPTGKSLDDLAQELFAMLSKTPKSCMIKVEPRQPAE